MDVVVIGCGASGVAALRTLRAAGLRAVGLEASDRVGGRINTVPFAEGVVDLGAQWCHGEKDNIVFELVKDLAVLDRPKVEEQVFLLSNGTLLHPRVTKTVEEFNQILEQAEKNNCTSIAEYLRNESNKLQSRSDLTPSLLEWYERTNHLVGRTDEECKSLRGLEEAPPCEGEFLLNWMNRGYKTIIDVLLNKYPDAKDEIPVEMLLHKRVETVKWKSSTDEPGSPLVQVLCADGSMYAAKCVIVTVSVGVLRERHEQIFKPALPETKVKAINNIELCVLDKIYVEFAEPWWPNVAHFPLIWREEDKPNSWISEVYGVGNVEYHKNVLCFWIYGEGAKSMEAVSEEDVKKGVELILEMFFRSYRRSPIKKILRSRWASDELTRGAYSYRCVNTERFATGASDLSEPLYGSSTSVPAVCFAGEATSIRRHGAVHGAVEAGIREANRIIKALAKH